MLPPVFGNVPSVTGSGLAAPLSQSLETTIRRTRRSVAQFIAQYRTDGQYGMSKGTNGAPMTTSAILRKPSS